MGRAEAGIRSVAAGKRPEQAGQCQKLRRLAQQYCQTKQASLAEWLQNVKDLRASSSKEPAATVQADDALQIMTIHNSKGLEFDLVILPQLDKSVKGDTASIKYLPGKEGEQGLLGIKVPDKEMQLQKSGVYEQAKARDSELEEAESRRLLYVAMTRAQKQLLMVGTVAEEKLPDAVIGLPAAKGCGSNYRQYTRWIGTSRKALSLGTSFVCRCFEPGC